MSASPNPPRPPEPPPPPRSNSHILAIALLVLALIVVAGGLMIYTGVSILSRSVKVQVDQSAGKKEVSIKTPLGSLEVHPEVDVDRIGLPLYPGATRVQGEDSATVNINIAGEHNVRVLAGKFETRDPIDKVRDYYHAQLGDQVTRYTEKNQEGKTIFEIKRNDQEKVVALKAEGDRTRIELVRVAHAQDEGN